MISRRTHVVLPEELIEKIDKVAGKRKRSSFIEEAVRHKLLNEAQKQVFRKAKGILNLADYPEWDTPEKVSAWVAAQRELDDERTNEKVGRRAETSTE